MRKHKDKDPDLTGLISRHIPHDGVFNVVFDGVRVFQRSGLTPRKYLMYEPALIIVAQGVKGLYLNGTLHTLHPGSCLVVSTPMALETTVIDADEDNPMLGLGIVLDYHRLAELIIKIDKPDQLSQETTTSISSGSAQAHTGLVHGPASDVILEVCARLMECLSNPDEAAILGDLIISELFYRLLSGAQGEEVSTMLRLAGPYQQISNAVNHLHKNLHKNVSIEELAATTHMSASGLHKKFKEVMQLSPLQYVKLMRLNKARTYITEGKSISEAAHAVGYNSLTQFSREYKRQFGTTPSDNRT